MQTQEGKYLQEPPILIYFAFRGMVHPIRLLLSYISVPHYNIELEDFGTQIKNLSQEMQSKLRTRSFSHKDLPVLFHEGRQITTVYCIMVYLCKRFNRADLLGQNMRQRARIQQISAHYMERSPSMMMTVLGMMRSATNDNISDFKRETLQKAIKESTYIKECCQLISSNSEGFILSTLTILDFCFLDTCFYLLSFYSDLICTFQTFISTIFHCSSQELSTPLCLKVMKSYRQKLEGMEWYRRDKEYLEKYGIVCHRMSSQNIEKLKVLWCGNQKYLKKTGETKIEQEYPGC